MGSHQQTTKMGEGSKQVRVDNWGIFFLQRLQMFFNKTDYCDLTLQFEGNVQLKVHRLVMNACTEYFHILEQTCEVVDDILIMPSDLQADVVLPIVNFMYTGMLEFHMSIFDKLYKTANLMNITVLTKLLDAQKTPIAPLPKPAKRNSQVPHIWNLQGKKISAKTSDSDLPATLPGRKLPVWKRKSAPAAVPHTIVPHYYPEQKRSMQADPLACFDNTPKPTRFEWPEDDLSTLNLFDSSFDDISYTSKPLLTQEDEPRPSTSFDRIKDTPDVSRRSTSYSNSAVDMEDVKDYVKEQRIRSNMNEDDDDDVADDFDSCNLNNKTDSGQESQKRKIKLEPVPAKRVRFSVNEKENQIRPTKINITPTRKTNSDVDHTKIISEVLKKYPNLVKKNKNIRLKILAKSNNTPVALEQVKKPVFKKGSSKMPIQTSTGNLASPSSKVAKSTAPEEKNDEDGPWRCLRCSTPSDPVEFVLYYLFRKHMTDVHNEKFDSRMCKFCGHKSTKHNMLMYHQYTKHGVKPPPAYNFPKCSQCPYIALTETLLVRHKMNHTKYELQCIECKVTFTNQVSLTSHVQITGHTGKSDKPNYDCQYCTKKFPTGATLFSHIRLQHRDEARRDGIVSIDEIEDAEDEDNEEEPVEDDQDEYITPDKREKIKILSDVKLPSMDAQHALEQQNIALEPSSEAEALSNVASGIATSLGLVDVVVLDENQQYILHTDNQQGMTGGESEFILPDLQDTQRFTTTQQVITSEQNVITQSMLHNSDIGSTDELVMVLTDHDYGDGNNEIINNENSNIVVLYSHPIEGQENQFITSQGNLMLTSQAGLIELRNGNVVTSTAQHFINNNTEATDNTHIESIEMIQREINQHPDIKNQIHLVQDIKPTLVRQVTTDSINIPTSVHSLPQLMEIQSTDDTETDAQTMTGLQENVQHEEVQFNTLQDIITGEQCDISQETQQGSGTEDMQTGVVDEELEVEIPNDSKEGEELAGDSSTCHVGHQDIDIAQVQGDHGTSENSIVLDDSTTVESSENVNSNQTGYSKLDEQENVEDQGMPGESASEEVIPQGETPKDIDQQNISISEHMEQAADENDENDSPIERSRNDLDTQELIGSNPNEDLDQALDTTEEDDLHQVTADSNEDQNAEISTLVNKDMEELPLEETEAEETAENLGSSENVNKTFDTPEQESTDVCSENFTVEGESLPVELESSSSLDANVESHAANSELPHENLQLLDENVKSLDESPQSHDVNAKLQEENSNVQDQPSHLQDGDSQMQDDEISQLQEENSQLQDDNSQLQMQDDNSQLQDDNSQSQDLHSHTSHTSQGSLPSKHTEVSTYSRNNSHQSAKIILDDWEDTDSQQSDTKNGTAVHKLIDDWDDDEDESKKMQFK